MPWRVTLPESLEEPDQSLNLPLYAHSHKVILLVGVEREPSSVVETKAKPQIGRKRGPLFSMLLQECKTVVLQC